MYAVLFQVDMKDNWAGDMDAELDVVTKTSAEASGYVRGMWAHNEAHGMSVQLFESEESARGFADNAVIPPEAAVTFRSVEVYEVSREV